jgi:hypothetical protein
MESLRVLPLRPIQVLELWLSAQTRLRPTTRWWLLRYRGLSDAVYSWQRRG